MENASKALIIAGGILLAILTITLLIIVFSSVVDFRESGARNTQTQQIAEFNNGFLAYKKSVMYGTDVLSVYRKGKEGEYKVEIIALDTDDCLLNIENTKEFKRKIFECKNVTYEDGRVKLMQYKEK